MHKLKRVLQRLHGKRFLFVVSSIVRWTSSAPQVNTAGNAKS